MRSRRGYISDLLNSPVAVGTALAGGPPRRSQRAGFPHWAPALGTNGKAFLWVGMQDACRWQVPFGETSHAFPGQAVTLATAS